MIVQLTARLSEQEAELVTLRTIKNSLDASETDRDDAHSSKVDSQLRELQSQMAEVTRSLEVTPSSSALQGDAKLMQENESLRGQLSRALSTASSATKELNALRKQTQDEFKSIWEAVQLLNATSNNKDSALAKLVSENKDLTKNLQKERDRVKALSTEIEMLDKALLEAVDAGSDSIEVTQASNKSQSNTHFGGSTNIPSSESIGARGSSLDSSAKSVAMPNASSFSPSRSRDGRSLERKSGTPGKTSNRAVTRPFTNSVPASPDDISQHSAKDKAVTRGNVEGTVDETLKELGRFLVHDTAALSIQQASRIRGMK